MTHVITDFVESGQIFFTMRLSDPATTGGRIIPVWTRNLSRARHFPTAAAAEAVRHEWGLFADNRNPFAVEEPEDECGK